MPLLIKKATILQAGHELHQQELDILIENGVIADLQPEIEATEAEIIEAKGAFVSAGWCDIGVQIGDPGFEHREDLQSVSKAAAAGGYTAIASFPNTNPIVDSKSGVRYIKNHTQGQLVDVHPIGAISQRCNGKDITEMYDMAQSGAVAFSDGTHPVQHAGLLLRALQYVKAFNSLVINYPYDSTTSPGGQLHEDIISTSLGMKGIPSLAEELMVQRDLELLEYADSRLHLFNISTAGAVERVRQAKKQGLQVTASVPVINLIYTDEAVQGFDTNFKVLPPLRSEKDRQALIAGLQDGTIDCITSNHVPLEEEAKKLEFLHADFGTIGLETTYALCQTHLAKELSPELLVEKLALAPRKLLGLPIPKIEKEAPANLTIFHPSHKWSYSADLIFSKSRNTPLLNQELSGRVLGVVNNDRHFVLSS